MAGLGYRAATPLRYVPGAARENRSGVARVTEQNESKTIY